MQNFNFIKPNSLEEISRVLAEKPDKVKLAAGCTDIIPALRRGVITPETMVSIKGVDSLSYVTEEDNSLHIGAATTLTEVAESELVGRNFPALANAAENVGSKLVQNSATIAGNLCNASPAADTAPPLLVYGAKVKIFNQGTEREVELSQFFVGPGKTILEPGDVVVEVILPLPKENSASIFIKQGKRKALEISILSVAVNLTFGDSGEVAEARIACGAVGPTPILAAKAAEKLIGKKVTSEDDLKEALDTLATEVSPISDIRSTGEYRQHMICVLAKRAIKICCEKGA